MFCKDCQMEHEERFSPEVRQKIEADYVEFLAKAKAHMGETVFITLIATMQPAPGSHSMETCLLSNMPMEVAPGILDVAKEALTEYVDAGTPTGHSSVETDGVTFTFNRQDSPIKH